MTAFLFFRYDIFDKSVLYASQRVFRPHKRATVHIWYHIDVDGQCVRRKSLPHRCVILEGGKANAYSHTNILSPTCVGMTPSKRNVEEGQ